MTAAIVHRIRHAEAMGRPCCYHIEANADALRTAGAVIAALALPVKVRAAVKPRAEELRGLPIVRYSFELAVPGRSWAGSGAAQDTELVNPNNWRVLIT